MGLEILFETFLLLTSHLISVAIDRFPYFCLRVLNCIGHAYEIQFSNE